MQKNIRKTMEDTFAAAAFAEAGEHDTAMEMAGIQATARAVWEKVMRVFDVHMSATCFAEAGCHETARGMLDAKESRQERPNLDEFLESVGLQRTQVRFGLASV